MDPYEELVSLNPGNGSADSITGASVTYAGGGGGSTQNTTSGPGPATGGGGTGGSGGDGTNGLGGGGGGNGPHTGSQGGDGGSGVVIVRAPADFAGTISPGTNTITTSPGPDGAAKICTFTVSGTLTGS